MKPFIFYGCSDDTFGEYGRTSIDHDNCASGRPVRLLVEASDGCLVVVGQYAVVGGGWMIGIARADDGDDDGVRLPSWPMRFRNPMHRETPYSVVLEIDAPTDAKVTVLPDEPSR